VSGALRTVIVGAGGFGREVLSWALDCHEAGRLPPVGGFIDDQEEAMAGFDVPRLGPISDYSPAPGDRFVVAVGKPSSKRKLVEMLSDRGAEFATLIHPTAVVTRSASLGEGVIMTPFTMANPNAVLERFVTLISFSGLGHDARAGEFTTISSHVDVTGFAELGRDVFVASGARILPGVKVGDGATIGAGAVVIRRVKPGATVYTEPAKLLFKS
jgi:sugar O-acyltransferase (sialic acid O-acetyltransferase NeuD family)